MKNKAPKINDFKTDLEIAAIEPFSETEKFIKIKVFDKKGLRNAICLDVSFFKKNRGDLKRGSILTCTATRRGVKYYNNAIVIRHCIKFEQSRQLDIKDFLLTLN